ncbi:hypothetical protein EN828_18980 [Mesorhizobium sp. M2D.F.Ca.ET.185.01.1.1]|nr:hypothetical protein EN783_14850 [Mesorhizobium sp. M2D.F.Ca.ET.140.01.1.1]TGP13351.1 hypothetical protein EN876_32110 [Mesorhizobium sp. M2D.F.Ca.ET.233.01.1.1]TGP32728.1 hypothetical protein EN875_019825 [Mesorhizobium sp. M2D.F.Ca.ET.232.01.1.1]TGP58184.1 hypothetical protein EN869_019085 [Mesorhizobium sp. M2D.F.Ca.ET.226.01.1.1]TGP67272.1 hypothetical protein EN868_17655 [Mesorhizobium sp. M2D.F.Ca.ET.225.01.1.1]TGP76183.1 hypothetical protein EN867_15145 [Mesorhizobium sp. M2D.F.Ca.ET
MSKKVTPVRGAPLCPAGHLPHKGGDWQLRRRPPFCHAGDWRKSARHLISPQAGEMSGRTEGGAKERGIPNSPPPNRHVGSR